MTQPLVQRCSLARLACIAGDSFVNEQADHCCGEVFDAFPFQLSPLTQGMVQFWCSKGFYPWLIVLTVVSNEAQTHRAAMGKKDEARHAQVLSWVNALNEEAPWIAAAESPSVQDAGRHAMWARKVFGKKVDLVKWQAFMSQLKVRHDFRLELVAFVFEAFTTGRLTRLDQLSDVVREFGLQLSPSGP